MKMEEICNFIIDNVNDNDNKRNFSVSNYMSDDVYIINIIDDIYSNIYRLLDNTKIKDFKRFDNNIGCNNAIIVSFKYYNIQCHLYEYFSSNRDYLKISITPI